MAAMVITAIHMFTILGMTHGMVTIGATLMAMAIQITLLGTIVTPAITLGTIAEVTITITDAMAIGIIATTITIEVTIMAIITDITPVEETTTITVGATTIIMVEESTEQEMDQLLPYTAEELHLQMV